VCSEGWFAAAEQQLALETGILSHETVQARLAQCIYLLSTSRANQAWYLFGTTYQLILALGIHRKHSFVPPKMKSDYIHAECRKRIFWTAYILDKYISVMLGRPWLCNEDQIDQEYPDIVNDEDMTPAGPRPRSCRTDCVMTASICHAKYTHSNSCLS
jgi:hypothetical protein